MKPEESQKPRVLSILEKSNIFDAIEKKLKQVQSDRTIVASAVSLALSFCLFASPAFADIVPVPTLDNLHNQGNTIPNTNPAEVYPESAYTLTEYIRQNESDPLPANVITLYDKKEVTKYYDPQTGKEIAVSDKVDGVTYKEITTVETTPKYYTVSLKQTQYGNAGATGELKTFTVTTPNLNGTGDSFKYDVTYKVDDNRLSPDRITSNQSGKDLNSDFVGLKNDVSGDYAYGGAIYNNNGSIGDITGDFIENIVSSDDYTAYGGAIYNNASSTIGNVTGDFIANKALSSTSATYGGAIYNNGKIESLSGDFIANSASSGSAARGGAIYNSDSTSNITNITGNFVGNYASSDTSKAIGGAIYNYSLADIGNITGDFIANYAKSEAGSAQGGAIVNENADISNIAGDFIGNYTFSTTNKALGGAIYNYNSASITNITGNFIENYAKSVDGSVQGGAILNQGSYIENIFANFIGNSASTENNNASGGAIYNDCTSGNITGDFIGNYAKSGGDSASGGAIYNTYGDMGQISGDFVGNYVMSDKWAEGGAIYNELGSSIDGIKGDFINNYAISTQKGATGGAIYNRDDSVIGNIVGDFIGNYAVSTEDSAKGGAIYNDYIINSIDGNFISNYAKSEKDDVYGGAIYNDGNDLKYGLNTINGDFIANYVQTNDGTAYGGAIYNDLATIQSVTGDFINNSAVSVKDKAEGGAINNNDSAFINELKGDFVGNYVKSTEKHAFGGAVYNDQGDRYSQGGIPVLEGNFLNNYAISEKEKAFGGGLYTDGLVSDLKGDFISNYVQTNSGKAQGGAIYVDNEGEITKMVSDFVGNYAVGISGDANGGAIYNNSVVNVNGSTFTDNYTTSQSGNAYGGAIYNLVDSSVLKVTVNIYDEYDEDVLVETLGTWYVKERPDSLSVENAVFSGNKVSSVSGNAYGGAIYNNDRIYTHEKEEAYLNFYSDSEKANEAKDKYDSIGSASPDGMITDADRQVTVVKNSSFVNNSAVSKQGNAKGGAIYTSGNMDIVADNFESVFSGNKANDRQEAIYVDNSKYWTDPTTLTLKTENNGKIIFDDGINGTSEGYNLVIAGDNTGEIYLNNTVKNANISIDATKVYLNDGANLAGSKSLELNSGVLNIANFSNQTVDLNRFSNSSTITIGSVDVDLQKETMGRITAKEYGDVSGNIDVQGVNLLNDSNKEITNVLFADKEISSNVAYTGVSPVAYSPIYKYEVSYNPDDGFFTFLRGGVSSGNQSDNFNPSVLAPSVAQQAGAYTTQLQTFNYAFQHADTFMNIPYLERISMINKNKYAMSPTGEATDVGTFSPLLTKEDTSGFWVKPYASFESIPLNNGPKVSNINYGTLVGYDSPLTSIAKGWERVLTGYVGYNGASQRYSGVDAYQNGGILGGTATMYKGNFFNATTLSVGATAGDASTMYGSENYAMLLAGIGNKTGYNFEFKDGRIILQPNFLISYTFVNTFDYTNGAGVRIKSDPLNAIQLAPGLKLIGNTKNGWQPYLSVAMIWNLLDDSKVTANDVRLPEMSIDPYIQYGAGIQKRFKDRFIAFGQAMIHNGGRNGISLTGGIRWTVGK